MANLIYIINDTPSQETLDGIKNQTQVWFVGNSPEFRAAIIDIDEKIVYHIEGGRVWIESARLELKAAINA